MALTKKAVTSVLNDILAVPLRRPTVHASPKRKRSLSPSSSRRNPLFSTFRCAIITGTTNSPNGRSANYVTTVSWLAKPVVLIYFASSDATV